MDAGFVTGQPLRLQPGMFQAQERTFDPVPWAKQSTAALC